MNFYTVITVISISFFVVIIPIFLWGIFKSIKSIRESERTLQNLGNDQPSKKNEAVYPLQLNQDNWAQFEGGVPNLREVILLLDKLDQPKGELLEAIMKNLRRKVKYYFYISSTNSESEISGFKQLFKKIADLVIDTEGLEIGSEDLFKIIPLKFPWKNVPYVFYRTVDTEFANNVEKGYYKTVGFRGDEPEVGIAGNYTITNGYDAEAIVKFLAQTIIDEKEEVVVRVEESEFIPEQPADSLVREVVKLKIAS